MNYAHERIALGFGDNIDYEIVWDSRVLEDLVSRYGIQADDLSPRRTVTSERDLLISILHHLRSGTGGEYFVADSALIERFARYFDKRITLGGTSVRAAAAMRKLGHTSALHLVTVNDHVRGLIPPDSPYVCSNTQDTLYPHLIVQFAEGDRVRAGEVDVCAGRANRIIYHSDADNIAMRLNEEFGNLITQARVLLIAGFNAMQSEAQLADRLQSLRRIMAKLPREAMVFCEDAGYYHPGFSQLIYRRLAANISIVSMNEDELQAHVGRPLDVLDVNQIKSALADLRQIIPAPALVVHTMYWALAYGDNATRFEAALRGGTTMATTRFCYGDDFMAEEYASIEKLPPNQAGALFAAALKQRLGQAICCVPVPQVHPANATTVGLGDAFVGGFLAALAL